MASQPPRRYTLATIPLQREIAAALGRSLNAGRLAHAYLFAGPRGVGKEAMAYAFGAAVLCRIQPGEGCGACRDCRRVLSDLHPDFLRYEAPGMHFPIGDPEKFTEEPGANVRKIIVEAGRRPSEGSRKILVVMEPEKMAYRGDDAANAFLKTLEEPPPRATFILISHDPRQLLPTIVSRCVPVNFPPLPAAAVEALLINEFGIQPEVARAAARRAEGTITGALTAASEEKRAVYEQALRLWEDIVRGGIAAALTAAANGPRERETALELVAALTDLHRDVVAAGAGAADVLRWPEFQSRYALLSPSSAADAERRWEALAQAARALHANANVALTLEELFLALARRG